MSKRLAKLTGAITESKHGKLSLVLMAEGRSKNGVDWGRVLDRVAALSVGRPIQALEFGTSRFKQWYDHMIRATQGLPETVRSMIPNLFHNTTLGVIEKTWVEGVTPNRRIMGVAALRPEARGFSWVLQKMSSLGQSLPGVSIFLEPETYKAQRTGAGLDITDVLSVSHYDVATAPSAGGSIQAVLESMTGQRAGGTTMKKKLFELLMRLMPTQAEALKTAIAEADRSGLTMLKLKDADPKLHALAESAFTELGLSLAEADEESKKEATDETDDNEDEDEDGDGDESEETTDDESAGDEDGEGDEAGDPVPEAAMPKQFMKGKGKGKGKGKPVAKGKKPPMMQSDAVVARVERIERAQRRDHVRNALAESKLPKWAKQFVSKQFGNADPAQVDGAIRSLKASLSRQAADPASDKALSSSGPVAESGLSGGSRAHAALMALMEGKPSHNGVEAFKSIGHAYSMISGDLLREGPAFYARKRRTAGLAESFDWESNQFYRGLRSYKGEQTALFEAINTAGFPLILADVMHKRAAKEFAEVGLDQWRNLATVESVSDFKNWRVQRFGEYGVLPAVAENGVYNALTTPSEEEVTMKVAKFGGTEAMTWESIKNDDTRRWRQVPSKLARAAAWTLHTDFFTMISSNQNVYDGVTLFHASHNNVGPTSAMSLANLAAMIQKLRNQKDISAVRKIGIQPKYIVIPTDLVELAYEIIASPAGPAVLHGSGTPNSGVKNTITRYGLEILEIPLFSDTNNYYLFADPSTIEYAAVAFLDGRETPEIFIQDLATVGTWFDRDSQTLKVRYLYDVVWLDWRGGVNAIVA